MKYYNDSNVVLYCADTFEQLKKIKSNSVDLIITDPPYFLSNDGITCKSGRMVSVNKGDWDKIDNHFIDKDAFNNKWISLTKRILKDTGSIMISSTIHNLFSIGNALEKNGFKILNNITWQKTNPPPNLSCKCFTHSTENIIWACKSNHKCFFNYQLMKSMNGGKQMKDVIVGSTTKKSEKRFGAHPAQKPIYLYNKLILAATKENDLVLDCFCGSGTSGVVCRQLKRKYIGIDNNKEYLDICIKRLENEKY